MTCMKCDNDLAACTCPELEARLEKILTCEHVIIGKDYEARIRKQIERNKVEQTAKE